MTGSTKGPVRFLEMAEMEQAIKALAARAKEQGLEAAVLGGFAMRLYGSDRLTTDVDFAADGRLRGFAAEDTLTFGGVKIRAPNDVPVDWIVRGDEYQPLYEEAIEQAVRRPGFRLVRPEYLAAMKLAARRPKDHEDLVFLLQSGEVDLKKARRLVEKLVGGRFARDEFDRVVDEAEWRASREKKGK